MRVIFATTALGMGVDAPNIENIIHITPPANLESYVQEIGRAGRSGNQSYAMIYYNNKKPRLITGRQGILQLWKLTQNSPGHTSVHNRPWNF